MTLNDILKALHSNNDDAIVNIINRSTYCENYRETESSIIIHTGFTFSNHNNKHFDLLFDLTNNKLINQVRTQGYSSPLICGIVYLKKSPKEKYYGAFSQMLIFKYDEINDGLQYAKIKEPHSYMNTSTLIESVGVLHDNLDKNYIISSFTVLEKDNEITYPLNKIYTNKLYFNGEFYSLNYFPNDDYEDYHNYY